MMYVSALTVVLFSCVSYGPQPHPPGLPRLTSYLEALLAHPAVSASLAPPEGDKSTYIEQMVQQYKEYVARRKAAAAAN